MLNQTRRKIYLDYHAGAPLRKEVAHELQSWIQELTEGLFSNPSSLHQSGRRSRKLLENARSVLAEILGNSELSSERLIFTSSATEAIHSFLESEVQKLEPEQRKNFQILLCLGDHSCMENATSAVQKKYPEIKINFYQRDQKGLVDLDHLISNLSLDKMNLVCFQMVHHETGVIQDFEKAMFEIKAHAGQTKICVDAVQALGKMKLPQALWEAEAVFFSGYKLGALAGIGLLVLKEPDSFLPLLTGSQEQKKRAGTENLLGILSFSKASEWIQENTFSEKIKLWDQKTKKLEQDLFRKLGDQIRVSSYDAKRVPGVLSITFPLKSDTQEVIPRLDLEGYEVSPGAACSSGSSEPSSMLLSMGYDKKEAKSQIRVSFGVDQKEEELEGFVETLKRIIS